MGKDKKKETDQKDRVQKDILQVKTGSIQSFDYDLFVIGAGSGGARAARMAAQAGLKVGIAENSYLGGTCVNVGCVPKKLFTYAAHISEDIKDAAGYGWQAESLTFDWSKLLTNKNAAIVQLNRSQERMLMQAGVTLHWARARLTGPHQIDLAGDLVTARTILIATGGWPHVPDIPGREHVITSNEAFFLEELPEKAVIVGGGYIAVEFASILKGLGVDVTQIYRGPLFLRGFDDDVRGHLATEMRRHGIDLRFDTQVARIEKSGSDLEVILEDGETIKTGLVLYATGRKANTAGLGLDAAGVERNPNGSIKVDAYFRTSQPHIFSLGDVIGRLQLTPVAIAEAMAFIQTLTGGQLQAMDYDNVPTAVFSNPNIGTVGLSEEKACRDYGDVDVYLSRFRPLKTLVSGGQGQALIKLITDPATDRVLGLHLVGPEAGEIVQGFAVAMKAGATKAQFDATVGIHPTLAEEYVTLREKRPASGD